MIETLIEPVTVDEAKAIIYAQLQRVGVATGSWKPGAVVRTIIAVVAVIVSVYSEAAANIARMFSYETATGEWLKNKAAGDGVDYIPATAAAGTVRLTNTAGGVFSVDAGDLVVSNPSTGVTYSNVAAFSLGALSYVDVEVLASEAGSHTTSASGAITELVTPLEGVTCTNQNELVGTDEESDELLRARARQAPALLSSAGPSDAYSYALKTIKRTDGTSIGVTRARTIADEGTGEITVVGATATGAIGATDLGYLQDQLVRNVLTQCARLTVESAVAKTVAISYVAYTRNPSVDSVSAKLDALNALRAYVAAVPLGGYRVAGGVGTVTTEALGGVIQGAIPGCFRVDVSLPTADVTMVYNEAMVLGTVTGSIQVERQQ